MYPSMAENHQATEKASYTSPQVNPYGRVDEEVASVAERDERRKKRVKCFTYLAAFIVFQTGIFLIFGLTIMKVRTPRFRVRSASFETFNIATSETSPSFNMRMIAELGIKNANFGQYKYQNSSIEFYYGDTKVGEVFVPRARAKARATRKFNVTVDLSSANVPQAVLSTGFRSNQTWIPLRSQSRLRGKVEIMKLMKKNKSTNMNCTMAINTASRQLGAVLCR